MTSIQRKFALSSRTEEICNSFESKKKRVIGWVMKMRKNEKIAHHHQVYLKN